MRLTILKVAGVAAVGLLAAAARPHADAAPRDVPTLDALPALPLGGAELRADADDSGRVVAELRVGERGVKGTYALEDVRRWADAADSLVRTGAPGRTPALRSLEGGELVLVAAASRGLVLQSASTDSIILVHADVSTAEATPLVGTLRHAAGVARAVRFVTAR